MFAPGVIIVWTGTNASIPAGWVRETTLDGKYPKGQGVEAPNITGGAATHTHTSSTHTHAINAHTHTYTLTEASGSGNTGSSGGGCPCVACEHNHTGSSGAASGGTTTATAVTYGAASNDPPNYEVIFIRSTGYNFFLPTNATVLWDDADIPDGLGIHDGSSASPNLSNKYLKGAGTGADAGGTGGSYTNTHDISHSHTAQVHTHVAATSSTAGSYCLREGGCSAADALQPSHTHQVALDNGTEAIDSYSGNLVTIETVEPGFRKLLAVKNTSGNPLLAQVGMIGFWLGSLATIPVGWALYSQQNDLYLKIATNAGELAATGGANTHTHAAQAHTHTSSGGGHTHATATISAHVAQSSSQNSGSIYDRTVSNHSLASASTENPGYASANTTADSSNNEPPYRTACYIQLDFLSGGAMALLL